MVVQESVMVKRTEKREKNKRFGFVAKNFDRNLIIVNSDNY